MRSHFKEVVQDFELKRVGGVPKNHQLTPLGLVHTNIYLGGLIACFLLVCRLDKQSHVMMLPVT